MPIGNPNPRYFGFSSFGQGTPKNVLVQLSSTQLLAANELALYREVVNNTEQAVWLQLGIPAVVGQGLRLLPGGVRVYQGEELFLGAIYAITSGSPCDLWVIEGV